MIKIKDYKGYTIYYEPGEESGFVAYMEDEKVIEAHSEQTLIYKLDRLTKQIFNPIPAFDHHYQHGRITSYNPEGRYPEFWFSADTKERHKHSIYGSSPATSFAKDIPENKVIIDEISALQKQERAIAKLIEQKGKTLAYITKADLDKAIKPKED